VHLPSPPMLRSLSWSSIMSSLELPLMNSSSESILVVVTAGVAGRAAASRKATGSAFLSALETGPSWRMAGAGATGEAASVGEDCALRFREAEDVMGSCRVAVSCLETRQTATDQPRASPLKLKQSSRGPEHR
jgi:hypothetical protein